MRLLPFIMACLAVGALSAEPARPTGSFRILDEATIRNTGALPGSLWESGQGDSSATGTLALPLPALDSNLDLLVAGYPDSRTLRISLQSPDRQRELKLGVRSAPGPDWTLYRWSLPDAWRNQPLLLIAEDDSAEQWIGVGLPANRSPARSANWSALLAGLAAITLTVLPFFTALVLLRSRFGEDIPLLVTLALVAAGGFALAVFFGFFLAPSLGYAVLIAGGIAAGLAGWRLRHTGPSAGRLFALPLAAVSLSVAIMAVTYLYGGAQSPDNVPAGRHDLNLPPDNRIPEFFAARIHQQMPLRPFLEDWLTSDRPPLQTGLLLQSRPFVTHAAGRIAASTTAQLAACAGLWVLLGALGLPRPVAGLCLLACVGSGFFVVNTLFAWPKLLPAGFLLAMAGLLWRLGRANRQARPAEIMAVGACAAFAMLGHGGSFFGLLALGIVHLLSYDRWRDPRLLAGSALVAFLLYSPWLAYQRWVDPPGDRLLKYHLAARTAVDPRGAFTVVAEAYRRAPADQIIHNKLSNFRVLAGDFSDLLPNLALSLREATQGEGRAAYWRLVNVVQGGAFFHLLQSLGILLLGLPGLWLVRNFNRPASDAGFYCVQTATVSVVIWCLLMFGPEAAVIHQGSYLTGLLLITACAIGLSNWKWTAGRRVVLTLHLVMLVVFWILSPAWNPWQQVLRPAMDWFWLGVLLVSMSLLAWCGPRLEVGESTC